MNEKLMKTLEELLRKVPDTYFDFIIGTKIELEEEGEEIAEKIIEFMQDNPNATTSDIIAYHMTLVPPQEIVFVDDDELDDE